MTINQTNLGQPLTYTLAEVEPIEPESTPHVREVEHARHVYPMRAENAGRVKCWDAFGRWYFADGQP